jgi:uncharacterized membrane protein
VFDLAAYDSAWPLAKLAGLFIAAMGVAVIAGSFTPRWRLAFVALGSVFGTLAVIAALVLGMQVRGPSGFQLGAILAAVVAEAVAFRVLMPFLHQRGERAVTAGTLMIVGAHFLVMTPAFGPLIGVLSVACCLNALAVWSWDRYGLAAAWFADGLIKLGFGALMALTAIRTI